MEMNDTTRNYRLKVTDPAIVVLMVEGSALNETLKKVNNTVAAVEAANPDLAIAMWQRCQQHVREAAAGLQEANRELAMVRRAGIKIDPYHMDAIIENLEPVAHALYPIGRFLAYTGVQMAYSMAKTEHRQATKVMRNFLAKLEEQKAVLTCELNRRLRMEVDKFVAQGGDRPSGTCSVMTAEKLGDPAYIVFDRPA